MREWDHGIQMQHGTHSGAVHDLRIEGNEVTAVELTGATGPGGEGNMVRDLDVRGNGGGVALLAGTAGAEVHRLALTGNTGEHLLVHDSGGNRLEGNVIAGEGGGDLGIELANADGNALLGNVVADTSDGGLEIGEGSDGNRIEGNVLTGTGDAGISVDLARPTASPATRCGRCPTAGSPCPG